MIVKKLDNGIRIAYENRKGDLTSFCIGFDAGANSEKEDEIGFAHAVEHMVFKGTRKRKEYEINKLCDDIFGFSNAMTNYPYVIYYGTTLSEDFEKAFDIYSDIVMNPVFPDEGFSEEKNIILSEFKEWKEDLGRFCEDELFKNAFKKRRIKNLIIGNEENIRDFQINKLKKFYGENYFPENCIISIVSSLSFDEAAGVVERYMGKFKNKNGRSSDYNLCMECNTPHEFVLRKQGTRESKIQFYFSIDGLTSREEKILRLFDEKFGKGTSSILYDEIRTRNGLAYDVSTKIMNEKGIKGYSITVGTLPENAYKAVKIINKKVSTIESYEDCFKKSDILRMIKMIDLKNSIRFERSCELCKYITENGIMFSSFETYKDQMNEMRDISWDDILKVLKKVFVNPSVQIILPF